MLDLAARKAALPAQLVKWWFAGPHAVLLERHRRLLSHLCYVDKPDAWAVPGNAVYGAALAWLHEDLPASHECWSVISGNSLGNVMECLLGIMWAEVKLKDRDLESFCRLIHSQALECLDDAVEDAWRFLKSMQPALAA